MQAAGLSVRLVGNPEVGQRGVLGSEPDKAHFGDAEAGCPCSARGLSGERGNCLVH